MCGIFPHSFIYSILCRLCRNCTSSIAWRNSKIGLQVCSWQVVRKELLNLNISFSVFGTLFLFSLVRFSVEATVLCANNCHWLQSELKVEEVSGWFTEVAEKWQSQEDWVALSGTEFFVVRMQYQRTAAFMMPLILQLSAQKSTSSVLLRHQERQLVLMTILVFTEHQEECGHCNGESCQAGQACLC